MSDENNNIEHEPKPDYENAEMDQLRATLKRMHKERFLMATTLYKVQMTLNRAKITRMPYVLPEK